MFAWKSARTKARTIWSAIIPLSQMTPDPFKKVCDRKFTSDFWTCSKFRGNTWRFKLLHLVSRTFAQRCTTLRWLARVLHEILRSQDDSHLFMRVLYNHASVVKLVAYDLATLYYRCTSLAPSIDTPYKQGIFQTRLDFQERTVAAAVPVPPHGIMQCHMLNIRLQVLTPSSRASTHTMARMIVRSPYVQSINARSIVRSPDHSYDAVASSYNTRFCCTAIAPGRKTCRKLDLLHIIAQRSPNGALDRACFRTSTSCEHL